MTTTNDRLLKIAREQVITEWGPGPFAKLGGRIQQALLAEAILGLAAIQDDEGVPAERVRSLVQDGFVWSRQETEG